MAFPVVIAGAAAVAALLAFAFGGKKKEPKALPAPIKTAGITAPEWTKAVLPPGDVTVDAADVSPEAALAKVTEAVKPAVDAAIEKATDVADAIAPTPEVTAKSPGWPEVPNAGATSGATSISKSGEVDTAFDELVAKAIAKGDMAALRDLAMQATLRGLTETAESIRDEIARITKEAPEETPAIPTIPIAAPTETHLGRATISLKAGSRGPDVVAWQSVVGTKQDGIFGSITDKSTRAWQKKNTLSADGIVGPKTWAAAYAQHPELATQPRVNTAPEPAPATTTAPKVATIDLTPEPSEEPAVTTTPLATTSTPLVIPPTIRQGSTGETVKKWQRIIKVNDDGIFGPITKTATLAFQVSRKLDADGIVGPKTWTSALTAPPLALTAPKVEPEPDPQIPVGAQTSEPAVTTTQEPPAPEPDSRLAARELTQYLNSLGGLAGRYKENKTQIKGWQTRLGLGADGMYGRNSAKAVILQGFVPVVPYYWPRSGTATAKREFTSYVQQYADSDTARKAQWDKPLSDVQRA
jgi:peptidoglycan hydrolase-like protein with peptidoglycan-binding domain